LVSPSVEKNAYARPEQLPTSHGLPQNESESQRKQHYQSVAVRSNKLEIKQNPKGKHPRTGHCCAIDQNQWYDGNLLLIECTLSSMNTNDTTHSAADPVYEVTQLFRQNIALSQLE